MISILVLDNYDSFTWNLVRALEVLGAECDVIASDRIDIGEVDSHPADAILLSPGPCTPREAGVCIEVARRTTTRPLLGVCLGHQVIAEAFGGRVVRAEAPRHGKTSLIAHDGRGFFEGIGSHFEAMRYHSLVVEAESLPSELVVSARSDDAIMGLRHRTLPIEGIQFHPESILTTMGPRLLGAWLEQIRFGISPVTCHEGAR